MNGLFLLTAVVPFVFGTPQQETEAKNWKSRVYLATYPRSGNHWVRYLIEEATHFATSSTYRDPDPQHLETVFPWGGYCCDHGYEGNSIYPEAEETVVVKTHFPTMHISHFDDLPYKQAIRIIRHPVDSFYSLYVWRQNYKEESVEYLIPRKKLVSYIESWRQFQEHWNQAENVLAFRYEDLYSDPARYLKLTLEAAGYSFTQEDIDRAVAKYPPTGSLLKHFDHFTAEDLLLIETELGDLMAQYGYEINRVMRWPFDSKRS